MPSITVFGVGIVAEHAISTFAIMDTQLSVTALPACFAFHALHAADELMHRRSLATFALLGVCVVSGGGSSSELVWRPVGSAVRRFGRFAFLVERLSMRVDIGVVAGSHGDGSRNRSLPILALSASVD